MDYDNMNFIPESGAFKAAAHQLHDVGLIVLPIDPTAKSPRVRGWNHWRGQSARFIDKLIDRHGEANIAILTGRGQTVIDCDDEHTLADAEHRFGKTPVVTRTPRGGGHLWFASTGERNANLRRHGLNIDIKGVGGYVLAPPSRKPDGNAYRLERGAWEDLRHLPPIKPGAIPEAPPRTAQNRAGTLQGMGEGSGRNDTLFNALLRRERSVATFDDLRMDAMALNAACAVPMPTAEVEKVVGSVWKIRVEGRNFTYNPAVQSFHADMVSYADMDAVAGDGDALLLMATLRRNHARRETFAVACRAMALNKVIPGWTEYRYEQARAALTAAHLILRVHKSRGKGDPDRFVVCVSKFNPNVINTRPAPPPAGLQV